MVRTIAALAHAWAPYFVSAGWLRRSTARRR